MCEVSKKLLKLKGKGISVFLTVSSRFTLEKAHDTFIRLDQRETSENCNWANVGVSYDHDWEYVDCNAGKTSAI